MQRIATTTTRRGFLQRRGFTAVPLDRRRPRQQPLSVLSIPNERLREIREELRGFGGLGENSVILQEASQPTTSWPILAASKLKSSVAVLTLSNVSSRNALTGKMMAELADAVDHLEQQVQQEQQLTALIVRGQGGFFCAGADLGVAKDHLLTPEGGRLMSSLMIDTLTRLRQLPFVTVAAIQGMAIGGGAELTTAMDFRIADSNVVLRFVHAKMGVTPGWGGATRLTRLVGRQRALQLLGTAQPLNAAEALEWGLVDQVVGVDSTMEEQLVEFLDRYVHAYPGVLHAAKKVVAGADDATSFEDAVKNEHEVFCTMWGGEANLAAVAKAASKKGKKQ